MSLRHWLGLTLKPGHAMSDFEASWSDRLAHASPAVEIRTLGKVASQMDEGTTFEGVRTQAYSATGISLLASLFIIFSTLSMGVHERIRQFAVLRAVARVINQDPPHQASADAQKMRPVLPPDPTGVRQSEKELVN